MKFNWKYERKKGGKVVETSRSTENGAIRRSSNLKKQFGLVSATMAALGKRKRVSRNRLLNILIAQLRHWIFFFFAFLRINKLTVKLNLSRQSYTFDLLTIFRFGVLVSRKRDDKYCVPESRIPLFEKFLTSNVNAAILIAIPTDSYWRTVPNYWPSNMWFPIDSFFRSPTDFLGFFSTFISDVEWARSHQILTLIFPT